MTRVLIAGDFSPRPQPHSIEIRLTYPRAVRAAGAVPAVGYAETAEDARAMADAFDSLILPGGGDLPAGLFGQTPHVASEPDSEARDLSDRLLTQAFRDAGKRILGICRGCQAVNVFLGGTLHQHLPDAYAPVLWHSGNITGRHAATIRPGTMLSALLGAGEIEINSSHHQAVDRPGDGLTIAATAPDGVVEAIEGVGLLLVQWHPERMGETMRPLFDWITYRRDA